MTASIFQMLGTMDFTIKRDKWACMRFDFDYSRPNTITNEKQQQQQQSNQRIVHISLTTDTCHNNNLKKKSHIAWRCDFVDDVCG